LKSADSPARGKWLPEASRWHALGKQLIEPPSEFKSWIWEWAWSIIKMCKRKKRNVLDGRGMHETTAG